MATFMLGLALSWLGVGVAVVALGAGAVVVFLRGWTHIALVLAAIAGMQIYAGWIYHAGETHCEAKVRAEVAAEKKRQQAIARKALARLNDTLDRLEAGKAEAESDLAAYQVEIAARPPQQGCLLSPEDADAIDR